MNNFLILDCTLRDGGYINDWKFGRSNVINVISKLTSANIDIIECGFLEDTTYDPECSFFSDVSQIKAVMPSDKKQTQFVAMTRLGYLDLDKLEPYDGTSIDGIRVTFHENEVEEAIEYCRTIKAKGYKVYVQPVGTTSYTDKYLLELIERVNELEPYAFYIVDTLGLMRQTDVSRMYYLLDNNLKDDIVIGFHSHNNLQLSFSNAQVLADLHTNRTIIVDSSVYGMGRGAGNLNTELIAQHLNMSRNADYDMNALLEIVDETISPLLSKYEWGYTVPYYLAAINNCHPNYASYLMNRKTLTVKSISAILTSIPKHERELYNKALVEELYLKYQKHTINDNESLKDLALLLSDQQVLILAPGASVTTNEDALKAAIEEKNMVVISVNFDGNGIKPDYYFFSNNKRFQAFISKGNVSQTAEKTILTSNVKTEASNYKYMINYGDYLNSQSLVNDNATLMLISLLVKLKLSNVYLAGFDGFEAGASTHYLNEKLETSLEKDHFIEMNHQIKDAINEINKTIDLQFLTPSLYMN